MSELHELLTEYVDERTPEQAPPFTQVESGVRRQRRRRSLAAIAVVALVGGGMAVATLDQSRADEQPAAPTSAPVLGTLDDGPPPASFMVGTTLLVLIGEIPVVGVTADPNSTDSLIVEAARDGNDETCLPHTVVRILKQDAKTVRIAAYRYAVAPDQPETQQCLKPGGQDLRIPLDLRWQLGTRKVLAGSTGNRSVLH